MCDSCGFVTYQTCISRITDLSAKYNWQHISILGERALIQAYFHEKFWQIVCHKRWNTNIFPKIASQLKGIHVFYLSMWWKQYFDCPLEIWSRKKVHFLRQVENFQVAIFAIIFRFESVIWLSIIDNHYNLNYHLKGRVCWKVLLSQK